MLRFIEKLSIKRCQRGHKPKRAHWVHRKSSFSLLTIRFGPLRVVGRLDTISVVTMMTIPVIYFENHGKGKVLSAMRALA